MNKSIRLVAQRSETRPASVEVARIELQTSACLDAIDVTDRVQRIVAAAAVECGLAFIQSLHTTAAIVVNEDEPLLWEDLRATLERFAPRGGSYRHDDFEVRTVNMTADERPNGHAHCKALFLPTSVVLGISGGRLVLGRWQRIFLLELDSARPRTVAVMVQGGGPARCPSW
jgi:secondary thiamine-phosphate synthase enzyme